MECKRNAQELVSSSDAPRNKNGRKKGYIEVITDLWNAKGYEHVSIKSQNLRDQASRLEKNASSPSISSISSPLDSNGDIWQSNILGNNNISIDATDENSSNTDANELSQDPNLHSSNVQFSEETQSTTEANDPTIENASNTIPDNLPH